ncbi:MAG: amidase [Pseudomonadota bacterium]
MADALAAQGALTDMCAALQEGRVTSEELVSAALRRIDRHEPQLNAFIEIRADAALEAARASDARRAAGRPLSAIDGAPYAVKDLIDVAGWPTTAGARISPSTDKTKDAGAVARLRAAGAVLLGKTGLHELAYGVTSENPHFGAVRNPWNVNWSPGGSSGGSGAAVAAGFAPLALGTDTGCSVRHPAHCCGVVGFKPSHGRISAAGVTPLVRQLDHVGCLTRSVADAALAFDVLAGFDPDDPFSDQTPLRAGKPRAAGGSLRFGRLRGDGFDDGDKETLGLVAAAIEAVATRLGAEVVDVEPMGLPQARRAAGALFAGDPSAVHGTALRRTPHLIGEDVRRKLEYGMRLSAGALAAAQDEARRFARGMHILQTARGVDAFLSPTCGAPAPILRGAAAQSGAGRAGGALGVLPGEARREHPWADYATVNCTPFNVSGQPSISVPCGLTAAGAPVGLMLTGARGGDLDLLALAEKAERALAAEGLWARRFPPLD